MRGDNQTDGAGGSPSHHVVAVDLAPFIATRRRLEVVGVIVHGFAATPVLMLHLRAALPLFVLDVLMVVLMVVVAGGGGIVVVVVALIMIFLRERGSGAEKCGERRESGKLSKSIHNGTSRE